ncbi:unnamed protein product [Mytilus coruscus]|uniref:CCHC-type domain-containing protein n=1 Tax=Mytilus coruscus TaxID=42192 RepID=A0A6J8CRL6_MYTCO|nr:unnamed protein product [Mytilus coruscus]
MSIDNVESQVKDSEEYCDVSCLKSGFHQIVKFMKELVNKRSKVKRCFNCSVFGHIRANCPNKICKSVNSVHVVEPERPVSATVKKNVKKSCKVVNRVQSLFPSDLDSYFSDDLISSVDEFSCISSSHLEYASSVWNPYKKKDIKTIENVQRTATQILPNLKDLSYEERLKTRLKFLRLRGDMIETYKITTGVYDSRVTEGLFTRNTSSTTRGTSMNLVKNRSRLDLRKYYFTNRVVEEVWNI